MAHFMTTLFETEISLCETISKKKVAPGTFTPTMFSDPLVFPTGYTGKKDGLYYCGCIFEGNLRRKANVRYVTLISIDVDDVSTYHADQCRWMLDQSQYEYIIHSTFSHTKAEPRFRIIIKPSRVMTYDEAAFVTQCLADELQLPDIDSVSIRPETPMFLPMRREETINDAFFEHVKGHGVDVDHYIVRMLDEERLIEDDISPEKAYDPLPVPAALSEEIWMSAVLEAYSAEDAAEYNGWFNVGMAIYHQTESRGFHIWLNWSRKNTQKHARDISEHEMEHTHWPTFHGKKYNGQLVTLRHILNKVTDAGHTVNAISYAKLIGLSQDNETLKRLRSDIQSDRHLRHKDYDLIAAAYRKKYNKMNSDDMSKGDVLSLLKPEFKDAQRKDFFKDRFVYSIPDLCYYEIATKIKYEVAALNYKYGSQMPRTNTGNLKPVHNVLLTQQAGYAKPAEVYGSCFIVNGKAIEWVDGRPNLNLFRQSDWPASGEDFDTENDEIDRTIEQYVSLHFKLLCNGEQQLINMLWQHLAHLRQMPMDKIHFAFAISSFMQGTGKSTLKRLYSTVLGHAHVNTISAQDLAGNFNAFVGSPKLMTFIEELEFDSLREKNKVIKQMKEMITGTEYSVRRMYKEASMMKTHTAFAIFSNDDYVLGHESAGRRWVPIIMDCATHEQAEEFLKIPDLEKFYVQYHHLIDEYPDRFIALFDAIDTEGFNRHKPPESKHKREFLANNPVARCQRILNEIIDDQVSAEITHDYIRISSAADVVMNYIDTTNSSDAVALKAGSEGSMRRTIERAVKVSGYSKIESNQDRFRLPFIDGKRIYRSDIFVRDVDYFRGDVGLKRLRLMINDNIDERTQGVARKVVPINPEDQRLSEIP